MLFNAAKAIGEDQDEGEGEGVLMDSGKARNILHWIGVLIFETDLRVDMEETLIGISRD